MPDKEIALRLPDEFDRLIRRHIVEAPDGVTDNMRRAYIAGILGGRRRRVRRVGDAASLVRLNGGILQERSRVP